MSKTNKLQEYRRRRKAGICTHCGTSDAYADSPLCEECYDFQQARWRALYDVGSCRACSHKREKGSAYCPGHAASAEKNLARQEANETRAIDARRRQYAVEDYIAAHLVGVWFGYRDIPLTYGRNAIRKALAALTTDGCIQRVQNRYRVDETKLESYAKAAANPTQ